MKGIILAGGHGTRLHPLTLAISKQLLPVYNKPMIYYPMSILMQAHIQDILIISTPRDLPLFERLFGNGRQLGLNLEYAVQESPRGLADAFLVGKSFLGADPVALALGDNLIYGPTWQHSLDHALQFEHGASIFACQVPNTDQYGSITFSPAGDVVALEEKPLRASSNFAIPGFYFYDNKVVEIASQLKPSMRGELEITDINRHYWQAGQLHVERLDESVTWFDMGTHDSLLQAANMVHNLEQTQGIRLGCLEEIATQNGWIDSQPSHTIASHT